MNYLIINGKISHKGKKKIRQHADEYVSIDNDSYEVGGSLDEVDGEWVYTEPTLTIEEIDAKLSDLDNKSKRPMRAVLTSSEDTDTSEDLAYLSELEAQSVALRAKRAELVGE